MVVDLEEDGDGVVGDGEGALGRCGEAAEGGHGPKVTGVRQRAGEDGRATS